jgi:predicted nucleotidyltransferase
MSDLTNVYAPSDPPLSLIDLKQRLEPFCRSHGVAKLELFGSFARGEAHPGGDIDLLITFRPDVRLGWNSLRFKTNWK